ncbi:ferredoxin [bacterium]|nr:ferredoxin [candidate division CSSED10-310 bacterium]
MKFKVDADTCIGCELCVEICPDVFAMSDDGIAEVIVKPVPETLRDAALQAEAECPVVAISHV